MVLFIDGRFIKIKDDNKAGKNLCITVGLRNVGFFGWKVPPPILLLSKEKCVAPKPTLLKPTAVSGNPMTTDRATSNRQKNDPKCQPHKMAHLVLPDTQANASQNQKSHFFANALTSFRH